MRNKMILGKLFFPVLTCTFLFLIYSFFHFVPLFSGVTLSIMKTPISINFNSKLQNRNAAKRIEWIRFLFWFTIFMYMRLKRLFSHQTVNMNKTVLWNSYFRLWKGWKFIVLIIRCKLHMYAMLMREREQRQSSAFNLWVSISKPMFNAKLKSLISFHMFYNTWTFYYNFILLFLGDFRWTLHALNWPIDRMFRLCSQNQLITLATFVQTYFIATFGIY